LQELVIGVGAMVVVVVAVDIDVDVVVVIFGGIPGAGQSMSEKVSNVPVPPDGATKFSTVSA
jgi:hypothetical protein